MCVTVQKSMFHLCCRQHTAAGLHVNMLKDNIEVDIKEMAGISMRTELNWFNILSDYQPRYLVETMNILPS